MLVTFRTKSYANIILFGDVAKKLLDMMGHSGTIPGALGADDVNDALEKLRAAISQLPADAEDDSAAAADDGEKERTVSLRHRALPLVELLEAAQAGNDSVMWNS